MNLCFASYAEDSAEEQVLRGLSGAMEAIDKPITIAAERAKDQYTNNGGSDLSSYLNLIDTESAENQYLSALNICTKYWIQAQFAGSRFTAHEVSGGTEIPLPKPILGKTIYLIPVINENDFNITTWECITDFTMSSVFKGDTTAGTKMSETAGSRSILAKYTQNALLSKCIYLSGSDWTNAVALSGDCAAAPGGGELLSDGSACLSDGECLSGSCVDALCYSSPDDPGMPDPDPGPTVPDGEPCSSGEDCMSGTCTDSICGTPLADDGSSCTSPSDCGSGICTEGYCGVCGAGCPDGEVCTESGCLPV